MKKIIITLLVIIPLSLTAQWEVMNEGFKGGINTIDFVNDNVGWIAGWNGTLLKTTDGGETWNNIQINENWNIGQIDFINESVGWAIGSAYIDPNWKNYIWKTSDGGNIWSQQFSSFEFGFNSFYVIDTTNVFAVGGNKIYKTSNGGTNWINISPNLLERNYNSVWFQDSQTGVVIGDYYDGNRGRGLILKTTNGGSTWNQTVVNEFYSLTDLQFIDNTKGYFKANNDSVSLLLRTEDMFSSWSIITQSRYGMGSYRFVDNSNVYAVIADSIIYNKLMKSTDGGTNWQHIPYFDIPNIWVNNIYFSNSNNGFIICSIFGSILFRTTDSGFNWTIQKFSYPLNELSFYDNTNGIMVGGSKFFHGSAGNIFSTNDGGVSWKICYGSWGVFRSCIFVNQDKGFSLTSWNGIYKTSDSGINWNIVYVNNNDSTGFDFWGSDICFKDENTIWAVGNFNVMDTSGAGILSTSDGGETWDLVKKFPNEGQLISICFADTTAWTVGDEGMIVKYTPQTGWVKQTPVTDLPLGKVFFTNDNNGFIAGGYQDDNNFYTILLKTTNGGTNWNTVPNVPYLFRDFAFIDNNRGWAIGYTQTGGGGILETIDGGITWNIDTGNLSSKLNALFIKDNYGWAVGENGLILRTTDAGAVWVEDENNNTNPTAFVLEQNYPNPFNPSTSIQYAISSRQLVTLKVYDVLGREVSTLVNEEQPQGVYEVEFDSEAISSGIYFYELRAGSYYATKKMLLLK